MRRARCPTKRGAPRQDPPVPAGTRSLSAPAWLASRRRRPSPLPAALCSCSKRRAELAADCTPPRSHRAAASSSAPVGSTAAARPTRCRPSPPTSAWRGWPTTWTTRSSQCARSTTATTCRSRRCRAAPRSRKRLRAWRRRRAAARAPPPRPASRLPTPTWARRCRRRGGARLPLSTARSSGCRSTTSTQRARPRPR